MLVGIRCMGRFTRQIPVMSHRVCPERVNLSVSVLVITPI